MKRRIINFIQGKSQVTTFTKILLAIVTVVCIAIIIVRIWTYHTEIKTIRLSAELLAYSSHVGKILLGNCLVYTHSDTSYAGMLNLGKVRDMEDKGYETCARNYFYGWQAVIETGEGTHRIGARDLSFGDAMYGKAITKFPVTLRTDSGTYFGKLTVTLVSGDLERIAGLIDRVCNEAKEGNSATDVEAFHNHYKMTINNKNKEICIADGGKRACRTLECRVEGILEFEKDKDYILKASSNNGVSVSLSE